jgi:hypothetical protein
MIDARRAEPSDIWWVRQTMTCSVGEQHEWIDDLDAPRTWMP